MKITKIFSNIEDPEETLYSVLLSEKEAILYSDFKEMLVNSIKHPFIVPTYTKEDGTPDKVKNALQSAVSCTMWG